MNILVLNELNTLRKQTMLKALSTYKALGRRDFTLYDTANITTSSLSLEIDQADISEMLVPKAAASQEEMDWSNCNNLKESQVGNKSSAKHSVWSNRNKPRYSQPALVACN